MFWSILKILSARAANTVNNGRSSFTATINNIKNPADLHEGTSALNLLLIIH